MRTARHPRDLHGYAMFTGDNPEKLYMEVHPLMISTKEWTVKIHTHMGVSCFAVFFSGLAEMERTTSTYGDVRTAGVHHWGHLTTKRIES